jgi:hypothetical protein
MLPFRDDSRARRLVKVLGWLAAVALIVVALQLLGVDVLGWFSKLWDALSAIGVGYLLAGWTLQTAGGSRRQRISTPATSSWLSSWARAPCRSRWRSSGPTCSSAA